MGKRAFLITVLICIFIILSSLTISKNRVIFSLFNWKTEFIQENLNDAQNLASNLGFSIPKDPLFIVDCSNIIAHLPFLEKYGGHYNAKINTMVIYQASANNIFHEYFHYIQDNYYNLDFKNEKYYWVLESSARWFENFTLPLSRCREEFDCFSETLFEPEYSNRYDRWMLFQKLIAHGPDVIPGIFYELQKTGDPCEIFRELPYFKPIATTLITTDFQNNFSHNYSHQLSAKEFLTTEPYQFDYTKIDGSLHITPKTNMQFIAFDSNLGIIEPQTGKYEGTVFYPDCYILGIINYCHEKITIEVLKDNSGYYPVVRELTEPVKT